jgi:O-antigen ligase
MAGPLPAAAPAPWPARVSQEPATGRDARWSLLLGCVVVYMTAAVGRAHQLWPVVGAIRPTMLSALAALVLIALDPGIRGRWRAAWATPAVRWLLAMAAWATLSIPLALYPGGAFDTVVNGLYKALAMMVAMIVAVRGVRDIRRLAIAYFFIAVMFSVVILTRFRMDDATQRLAKLIYYDANELALLAAASMPFGVFAIWRLRGVATRLVIVLGLAALFAVFVMSGSRGGVVALGVGLVYTVILLKAIKLRWRLLAIAIFGGAFLASASDQFWERMDSAVEQDDYNLTSPTGRVQVWTRGIGYMLDRPLLGVGAGNFQTAEGRLSDYAAMIRSRSGGVKWSAAHNSYVQVGAELGVPGLVLFLAAIFGTLRALQRVTRRRRLTPADTELVGLAYVSLVALIIFLVGATFLSLAYHDMLFALLGLAMGVQVVARRSGRVVTHPVAT